MPTSDGIVYQMATARKSDVGVFGPFLPVGGVFPVHESHGSSFRRVLLRKGTCVQKSFAIDRPAVENDAADGLWALGRLGK